MRAGLAAMRRARMRSGGHRRGGVVGACCAAVGLVMLLAACGPASGSASGAAPAANTGTVTYAMQPGGAASYPFPFMGLNQGIFDTVYNIDQFQYLLYRPLYWFGTGVTPYQNPQLSLASPAVYQGQKVTIRLKKNYKWSNGEPVDAQDVVFWMNIMKTEGSNDAYYLQSGLPNVVTDVRATSRYVVTMTIAGPYSQSWFSNNELSEITPLPLSWDATSLTAAPGSGGCSAASYSSIKIDNNPNDVNPATFEPPPISATAKACAAVYNFLVAQSSKNPSTFASSPQWSVVDGPWKIKKLDSSGNLTLTFNKKYDGPVAPGHITTFIEEPFTSEAAEFNVLQDPQGGQAIDVGYLPTVDAVVPPAGANVGANPRTLSGYHLTALYPWQLTYFPYNFKNTTGQAPIFDQLYFRDAFQHLVDQEGVINGPLHGYGKPVFGPVSNFPQTKYISHSLATAGDQWTLSISKATSELSSNGWALRNGVQTCVRPGTGAGQCGARIAAGTQLKFSLVYVSGIDWMQSAMRELASNASLAGIQLSLTAESFNDVTGPVFTGGCAAAKVVSCTWQMAFWGTWTYSPDYVPTGDELFENNAPNNGGGYNNPRDNQLILDTLHAKTSGEFYRAMYNWQNYVAGQLPVVYEPDYPSLIETINGLDIGPQPSSDTITPEEWHYLK